MKKATATTQTGNTVPSTYAQIIRLSDSQREEQQLQYQEEDALDSLKEHIKSTGRQLAACKRDRNNILTASEVDWNSLAQKDNQIEGYEKGLSRLQGYLQELFPDS